MFQISIYTDDWHTIFGEDETGIINPIMTQKLNGCGTLEYKVPVSDTYYNDYTQFKTRVMVSEDGALLFVGRLLEIHKDFNSTKDLIFEGEMALLNDVQYPPYEYSGTIAGLFTQVLEYYNSRCSQGNSIQVGRITVTDSNNYIARSNEDYSSCWECLSSKLIDLCGGYMQLRWVVVDNVIYRYLDYLENPGAISSQSIEFGENILNITQELSGADIVTVLIPFGAKDETTGERIDITSVNPTGKNYIVSSKYEQYGLIEAVEYWDDVTLPHNLYNKAVAYLAEHDFSINTLTVNAVDLHVVDEEIARLNVGDTVTVKSTPHGINTAMLITERKRNLDDPSKDTFTIGNQEKTFTSEVDKNNYGTFEVEGDAISEVDILYGNSDSTTTEPTEWSTTAEIISGKYLWQKTKTTYVSGSVVYSSASCIGGKGTDGKGISSIVEEYYLSTSQTEQTGGEWTTESVVWESGKYIWTRSHIYWSDSTDTTTTPILANGLNSMGEKIVTVESEIPTKDDIKSISEQQTEIMLGGSGGYLEILLNDEGKPEGLRVMDSEDESKAVNVWLFNKNGFGFSNTGVNGTYYNAWTIDGNLTADHMVTGTLKDKIGNFILNLDTGNLKVDKFVINTPDLFFGEYPDGQYIEVKNYQSDYESDYTKSTGSQYCDLAYTPESSDVFTIKFSSQNKTGAIFGSPETYAIWTNEGKLQVVMCNVTIAFNISFDIDTEIEMSLDFSTGTVTVNGTEYTNAKYSYSTPSYPIIVFARGIYNEQEGVVTYGDYSSTTFYYAKVENDSTTTKFKPFAKTVDNVKIGGVRNTTSSTDLTTSGTLEFMLSKVGVLFDGNGQVKFNPEGEFRIENEIDGIVWNELYLVRNDNKSTEFYLRNFDENGQKLNLMKTVGNGKFNQWYDYANAVIIQNQCNDDPASATANYLTLLSNGSSASANGERNIVWLYNLKYNDTTYSANSISMQSLPTTNSFNINNWAFDHAASSQYSANYITLNSNATYNNLGIYNVKTDNSSYGTANYVYLTTSTERNILELCNYSYSANTYSNMMQLKSNSTINAINFFNRTNDNKLANSVYYQTDSYSNGIYLYNYDRNGSYSKNTIQMSVSDSVSQIVISNSYPDSLATANSIILSTTTGLSITNQYSSIKMDMSGNGTIESNNSLTIKSTNYCITLDAANTYTSDSGKIYIKASRQIYLTGSALYWNGTKKW